MIFTQAIQRNSLLYKDNIATCIGGNKKTWRELEQRVAKLANALISSGIKPGDRVAILALNSDRYLEYYYAVAWAGAVMVPLNIRWSVKENLFAVNDSGTKALFIDDQFLSIGKSLQQLSENVEISIYMGDKPTPASMLNYEELINKHAAIEPFNSDENDLIGIFYTGGTTGFPKGVMLSHKNIWTSSFSILQELKLSNRETPVMLCAGPMFHLAAAAMCWSSVIGSVQVSILPMFKAEEVLECIQRDEVTDMLLVPTMISMLLAEGGFKDYDLSSLDQIIYGASPMPEGTLLEAMELMPKVKFCQAYGQTEMSPICAILPAKYHTLTGENAGKIRSAGRQSFINQIAIKDEKGNSLGINEVGEICAKGPNIMMGYWNNPEQTQAAIKNGWLHSGDAGYMDDDGFIFLVDRVKDMIVSGGENVFSAEVESAISKFPGVHEVAVIGIPSEQWGEAVHAIVRTKPNTRCDEIEIIQFCREYIAGYKVPRSIEFREEPFPITGAAKIQKNVLRKSYWKNQERNIN
ncbi:fatty-acid--CoA ligase [Gammaproteobacteria bacterium 42_54_T18]|nr:fatty-acid--CoA ligase [Gammaproteobacteria bacterium 42_54_T18]